MKPIASLGDVDFVEYGGFLVFDDPEDGPFVEVIRAQPAQQGEIWAVHRFYMERHDANLSTVEDGEPEWYAEDLDKVAACMDYPEGETGLRNDLRSGRPKVQADAYRALVDYFGPYEFDQYPLNLSRQEVTERYT